MFEITDTVKGISIDSRTIKKEELFVAIKGNTHDGHAFIEDAFKKGACGAVVRARHKLSSAAKEIARRSGRSIISVNDTVRALGEIACSHRRRFDIPLVAVTGSNGKTTTKEMIANILHGGWSPLKNSGTQNNLIGVPLTLLKLTGRDKSAVIEFGMNRPGEIKTLAEMARPNIGVITNIGPSHLERLRNLRAVYRAKKELLDFLGKGDIAVLNNDDIFLGHFKKKGLKIVTFGVKTGSDFQARKITPEKNGWSFIVNGDPYFIPLPAYHEIYNALTAISVAALFNVDAAEIKDALNNYTPLARRMARSVFNGIEFLDDTYNSNPLSMESAIRTLAGFRVKGKKVLVSGDMLELGRRAVYYHNRIGRLVARSDINNFIGVGGLMRNAFTAARKSGMKNAWACQSTEEAAALLKEIAQPDDVVLFKGSRAMRMEEVIKCFITSCTR